MVEIVCPNCRRVFGQAKHDYKCPHCGREVENKTPENIKTLAIYIVLIAVAWYIVQIGIKLEAVYQQCIADEFSQAFCLAVIF